MAKLRPLRGEPVPLDGDLLPPNPEPADTKFKPGFDPRRHKGREGTRSKFATALIEDLYEAWQTHGKAVVVTTAELYPNEFLKVCTGLLPRETHATVVNVKLERMSDRQLLEALARTDLISASADIRATETQSGSALTEEMGAD